MDKSLGKDGYYWVRHKDPNSRWIVVWVDNGQVLFAGNEDSFNVADILKVYDVGLCLGQNPEETHLEAIQYE